MEAQASLPLRALGREVQSQTIGRGVLCPTAGPLKVLHLPCLVVLNLCITYARGQRARRRRRRPRTRCRPARRAGGWQYLHLLVRFMYKKYALCTKHDCEVWGNECLQEVLASRPAASSVVLIDTTGPDCTVIDPMTMIAVRTLENSG